MGNTTIKFTKEIQCSLLRFHALMPSTTLIWSSILPSLYWHGAPLNCGGKIDRKRRNVNHKHNINRVIKKFILGLGGAYINHDCNITVKEQSLFRHDGTQFDRCRKFSFSQQHSRRISLLPQQSWLHFPIYIQMIFFLFGLVYSTWSFLCPPFKKVWHVALHRSVGPSVVSVRYLRSGCTCWDEIWYMDLS